MRQITDEFKNLIVNVKGGNKFRDIGVDSKLVLKWILMK
jgi:hypothetical protein